MSYFFVHHISADNNSFLSYFPFTFIRKARNFSILSWNPFTFTAYYKFHQPLNFFYAPLDSSRRDGLSVMIFPEYMFRRNKKRNKMLLIYTSIHLEALIISSPV